MLEGGAWSGCSPRDFSLVGRVCFVCALNDVFGGKELMEKVDGAKYYFVIPRLERFIPEHEFFWPCS